MERLTVCSSTGELIVDKSTGKVEIYNCDLGLTWITRFDLDEYKKYYNVTEIPDALDILDLGYWEKVREEQEQYEEPAHEWRIETQRRREGKDPEVTEEEAYTIEVKSYLKRAYYLDINDTSLEEWISDAVGKQTPVELVDQYAEKYDLEKFN